MDVLRRRRSELKTLGARKTLNEDDSMRLKELMEKAAGGSEPARRRPTMARILKTFAASEDWELSVEVGETVAVLDKRPDGWCVFSCPRVLNALQVGHR